jgi:transposase-like protein
MDNEPKTLQEAIIYFSDHDNCVTFLVSRRWPDGVIRCPRCDSEKVTYLEARRLWQCKARHTKAQFSIKVGTIFEDSALGLDKWLTAMWMIANCKNGVSSHEIASSLGITQKSAWHLLHRVRLVMQDRSYSKLGTPGPAGNTALGDAHAAKNEWEHSLKAVEVDESFLGGKTFNMHLSRVAALREQYPNDRAVGYETRQDHKTPVIGMFDRETRQVRAKVVKNVRRETLQAEILKNVKYGSAIYTDEAVTHDTLRQKFVHETVNHAETYVNGQVHTNSLENFWSLLKRNLRGTYVAVEPFHLDRYLDEQVFRFNHRIDYTPAKRFDKMVTQIIGRRLTYKELTGKGAERQAL